MTSDRSATGSGPGRRTAGLALPAALLGVLAALLLGWQLLLEAGHPVAGLVVVNAMFAVFGVAAWLLGRAPIRAATWLAVGGGAALQLLAVRTRPLGTDDYLRYAWEGRVQAAGVDPYRYPPGAPQLAHLRDTWLFPDGVTPRLNHPTERTIYPPVAQGWFWLVHVLSGGRDGQGATLQVAAATVAVATSLLLVLVLARLGSDPRRVVWWAWCPTVVLEAGGGAHVDVLAAPFVVLSMLLLARRAWVAAGAVLGLAVATKLLPILLAVAVPPRRSLQAGSALVAVVALGYLPHVAVLGTGVTGFLGGYLGEEGRSQFALLRPVLPDPAVPVVGWVLLAVTALLVWREAGRDEADGVPPRPWVHAATMVGIAFLLLAPPYPWYALLLVPLVALGARPVWLVVAVAAYLVYQAAPLGHAYQGTRLIGYGGAALVLLVDVGVRFRTARRGSAAAPVPGR